MRTTVFDSETLAVPTPPASRLVVPTCVTIDRNPVPVYIAGLAPGSRRTMRTSLRTISTMIDPPLTS